jgi:hypothetical protein
MAKLPELEPSRMVRGGQPGCHDLARDLAADLWPACPPPGMEPKEWHARLEELAQICGGPEGGPPFVLPDDQAVLAWLETYLPRHIAPVPLRHRQSFMDGVYHNMSERRAVLRRQLAKSVA